MNNDLSERQKEIIKASLELIAEKGIQGLTIKTYLKKLDLQNLQSTDTTKVKLKY